MLILMRPEFLFLDAYWRTYGHISQKWPKRPFFRKFKKDQNIFISLCSVAKIRYFHKIICFWREKNWIMVKMAFLAVFMSPYAILSKSTQFFFQNTLLLRRNKQMHRFKKNFQELYHVVKFLKNKYKNTMMISLFINNKFFLCLILIDMLSLENTEN